MSCQRLLRLPRRAPGTSCASCQVSAPATRRARSARALGVGHRLPRASAPPARPARRSSSSRSRASAKAAPSPLAPRRARARRPARRGAAAARPGRPRRALRAHLRQPLGIGLAAVGEHVAEDAELVLPVLQVAAEELQVAAVLEGFLELVLRQHLRQVAGVRHLGQLADVPEPAHLLAGVALEQAVEQLAGADGGDRLVEARALALEGGDRVVVALERLAVGAELGVARRARRCALRAPRRRWRRGRPVRSRAPAPAWAASARPRPSRSRAAPCSTAGRSGARARGTCARRSARSSCSAAKPSATLAWSRRLRSSSLAAGARPSSSSSALPRAASPLLTSATPRLKRAYRPAALLALAQRRSSTRGGAGVVAARHQQVGLQQHALFLQRAAAACPRCAPAPSSASARKPRW